MSTQSIMSSCVKIKKRLIWFYGVLHNFQQYFSYIVAVSVIGGENHRPAASLGQILSNNVVHLSLSGIRTHNNQVKNQELCHQ